MRLALFTLPLVALYFVHCTFNPVEPLTYHCSLLQPLCPQGYVCMNNMCVVRSNDSGDAINDGYIRFDALTRQDSGPKSDTKTCGVNYAPCEVSATINGFCKMGVCTTCDKASSTGDSDCTKTYGNGHICESGKCIAGDCHDSGNCLLQQLCQDKRCISCTDDKQCIADSKYGYGTICVGGSCVKGDCHNSSECTGVNAGKICGGTTPYTCSDCSLDAQCNSEAIYSSTKPICIGGKCSANTCSNTSTTAKPCASSGTTDICCNNVCLPGTYLDSNSCCGSGQSVCGGSQTCVNNMCSSGFRGEIVSISSNLAPPVENNVSHTFTINFRILQVDGQYHTLVADFAEGSSGKYGFWGDVTGPTCGGLAGTSSINKSVQVIDVGNYNLVGPSTTFCINYPKNHSEYLGGFSAVRLYDKTKSIPIGPWQKLGLITPAGK